MEVKKELKIKPLKKRILKLKHIPLYIILGIIIYVIYDVKKRNNMLNSGKVLYTIGEVYGFKNNVKASDNFLYKFCFDGEMCFSSDFFHGDMGKLKAKRLWDTKYLNKKFLMKFSTEELRYSEIYIDIPIKNIELNCDKLLVWETKEQFMDYYKKLDTIPQSR